LPPASDLVRDWRFFWPTDGIAPENLGAVFELFKQVDGHREGSGLGHSIVKKAVERMHGRTGAESVLGEGSCFWIELQPAERRPVSSTEA